MLCDGSLTLNETIVISFDMQSIVLHRAKNICMNVYIYKVFGKKWQFHKRKQKVIDNLQNYTTVNMSHPK